MSTPDFALFGQRICLLPPLTIFFSQVVSTFNTFKSQKAKAVRYAFRNRVRPLSLHPTPLTAFEFKFQQQRVNMSIIIFSLSKTECRKISKETFGHCNFQEMCDKLETCASLLSHAWYLCQVIFLESQQKMNGQDTSSRRGKLNRGNAFVYTVPAEAVVLFHKKVSSEIILKTLNFPTYQSCAVLCVCVCARNSLPNSATQYQERALKMLLTSDLDYLTCQRELCSLQFNEKAVSPFSPKWTTPL